MAKQRKDFDDVPVLPLPSLWRLVVSGLAIAGFLFFMYWSYEPDAPQPEPGSGVHSGTR